jgi:acetone carboxylase gamma subunit
MDTGGTMTDILDVDAVPVGYPVLRNSEPDTDAFCVGWLGKKAPDRR